MADPLSHPPVFPGWYPDLDGRPIERFWNGSDWTGAERPAAQPVAAEPKPATPATIAEPVVATDPEPAAKPEPEPAAKPVVAAASEPAVKPEPEPKTESRSLFAPKKEKAESTSLFAARVTEAGDQAKSDAGKAKDLADTTTRPSAPARAANKVKPPSKPAAPQTPAVVDKASIAARADDLAGRKPGSEPEAKSVKPAAPTVDGASTSTGPAKPGSNPAVGKSSAPSMASKRQAPNGRPAGVPGSGSALAKPPSTGTPKVDVSGSAGSPGSGSATSGSTNSGSANSASTKSGSSSAGSSNAGSSSAGSPVAEERNWMAIGLVGAACALAGTFILGLVIGGGGDAGTDETSAPTVTTQAPVTTSSALAMADDAPSQADFDMAMARVEELESSEEELVAELANAESEREAVAADAANVAEHNRLLQTWFTSEVLARSQAAWDREVSRGCALDEPPTVDDLVYIRALEVVGTPADLLDAVMECRESDA